MKKMKLFYLRRNPGALGRVPQESSVIGDYNFASPFSIYNVSFPKQKDIVTFPKGLNLGRGAKFTDFTALSIISYPYLVFSKAFYKVLKNFRLPEGRKKEVILKKGIVEKDYTIFWAYDKNDSCLDYPSCAFELYNREKDKFKPIEVNTLEDYLSLKESLDSDKRLICRNPIFNLVGIKEDLFLMPSGIKGAGYMVTESLKIAIENAGLTGITFKETS